MMEATITQPTRLQCGTVYTWNCAGELYAIECALCEEHPLCTLAEFAEHMDIWHSDWQAAEPEQAEDELMQEVLAETQIDSADNELKEQLVQQLNETSTPQIPSLSAQVSFGLHDTLPAPEQSKLTTQHVNQLIELYRAEPRLWNQSHDEFRDVELCRASWQRITNAWNAHCGRNFSVTDVRIRISTLCQRFLKQRERLEAEGGELDEGAKFVHYDQLSFLCEQQELLKRREHFALENRKLLEIYEHYPILWHNAHKRLRCAETLRRREEALRGVQLALRLCGINLSALALQRRLQSLRKCYRLEKIRYLHSVVEGKQAEFVSTFEHYAAMEFLHKHIDPYVCAACGKIFENLVSHQMHVQGSCQAVAAAEASAAAAAETAEQQEDFEATVGEIMAQLENVSNEATVSIVTQTRSQQLLAIETKTPEETETQLDLNSSTVRDLVVKVQCAEFAYELQLPAKTVKETEPNTEPPAVVSSTEIQAADSTCPDEDADTSMMTLAEASIAADEDAGQSTDLNTNCEDQASPLNARLRLSVPLTNKLIELYKDHVCLWNPNHLDYHTRILRRQAWQSISRQLNAKSSQRYSWQMLHRKLTDYTKYYKRERQREDKGGSKWCFFNAFRFLDDVLPISGELQKTLQQRDSNLKLIEVYQSYEQLWCTDHPDYTKRKQRLRHVESLCTRLQEECNLQITVERLKSRIIDFRCQYRQCKRERLLAYKRGETWQPNYEYYEALQFLEQHVSPFGCAHCPVSFKRRSDYLCHERNVHMKHESEEREDDEELQLGTRTRRHQRKANVLEHICHICGMKFSLRNSLLAHLRRHLGQRTHHCTECPKKFFNSTSLRVHMRSHTKEQPYVCEHCARGFVNASKLNQHVKRHRGQRDFPCSRCDKAFYTAHERDRHIRAHLNIRDKVCPYCARAFVVGSAYYAHMNLHRGDKRYSCPTCSKRFAQYAGLYKHRKRCMPTELIEE